MEDLEQANPYKIPLNFTTPDGTQSITFAQLDTWLFRSSQGGIIAGVRIGACIITMLALFFFMKDRRTPLFILNQLTLFFMALRSALYSYYYLSASSSITFAFSGYYVLSDADRNMTAAADTVQILAVASLEAAMACQILAMYRARDGHRRLLMLAILTLSVALGTATVGFYINSVVHSLIGIYNHSRGFDDSWQVNTPMIVFLASVAFNSFCLVAKFLFAFHQRKTCGKRQFSGLHALFIMTFQTMIIPAIINVASYNSSLWASNDIPEVVYFLTAIFLPLATMWAASSNNTSVPYSDAGLRRALRYSEDSTESTSFDEDTTKILDVISTNCDLYDKNYDREYNMDSFSTASPTTLRPLPEVWHFDVEKANQEATTPKEFVAITAHKILKSGQ